MYRLDVGLNSGQPAGAFELGAAALCSPSNIEILEL